MKMAIKRSKAEAKEYILKMAKEHDVKFIWCWFCWDKHGRLNCDS